MIKSYTYKRRRNKNKSNLNYFNNNMKLSKSNNCSKRSKSKNFRKITQSVKEVRQETKIKCFSSCFHYRCKTALKRITIITM
jgi:phage-related protein